MNAKRAVRRRAVVLGPGGAAAGAALLAACASGGPGGQAAGTAAAPRTVSGTVGWLVRDNPQELEWQKSVVLPELAKLLPQLTVDLIVSPGSAPFDAKLTALVVGGQSPEVWTHHGGRSYVDYLKNGWLEELTPLAGRDKLDFDAFLPNTVDWFRNKGRLWALPYYQSYGSFVFYNRQLIERAGLKPPPADGADRSWTWDAMVEMAKKLTRATGGPDAQFGLTAFADSAQFLSQTMAMLCGGDVFTPEHYKGGIAQRTQLDSPAAIEGHQARQDLIFRQQVIPTAADTQAMGVTGDLFQAGRIGLNLNAGWQVRSYASGIKDFAWGIAPIPAKKQSAGPQFTDAWMLGKQAKNRDGGWALIKHLLTPDAQRAFTRSTGSGGALKATEDEWFKLMGDRMPPADVRKVTEFSLTHSFELSQHTFAKWAEILGAIRQVTDPLWTNQSTAADALRAGKAQVDQVVLQAYGEYQGSI
jgi:multiple sugar transport system substrate-binding protein